ncbi:glycosyltransferase family 2 protein [Acidithiobacillus sp. HP-6]|uniref:glycosyltransferase family 2 protein n=1 Tax=unclassified Acidithiobacillus TaxID=2614800 RepID=UPI0018795DA8|nr:MULTISPECIES: glycosyltransferase family 2 protein [unclassified Acidithiobacillus]MBE7561651.1 glycosyltransferase family 2 protein [Acidithiobacillus sp. HP-6]MBE7568435.1 glycosyltransferase family 2 protein [Acidithiobacillus sp. HP-2]
MNETVAAVVVTYNRKQLLTECLDALLAQTRPVDKIILIDNASTDGTPELLKEYGYLDNPVIDYVRLPENTGGAGGFYEGVKRGYEAGYDWMWLMDDDAEPMPDALEKMSPGFLIDGVLAVANLKVSEDGTVQVQHRGWIDLCRTDGEVIKSMSETQLTNDVIAIEHASFVGLAVNKMVIDKVGYPKKEFFIHYDDFYYCYMISKIGKIILMRHSLIKHKDAAKKDTNKASILGRSSARVPLEKLWLSYFGLRNMVWMRKQHCSNLALFFYVVKYYLRRCIGVILYDDHKLVRMNFYLNAILDGWFGLFDNQKPRNITRVGS